MPTLNWIGKEAVVKHHKEVPFRLLEPVPELSCGSADSGNLIVQGDNLHALKALLPRYAGQVKCIYIDPPYNTGNEGWVYNDNVNSPEIRRWLGEVVGKEGETLDRHDRWLCMMYPRLVMLKQFLRDDGAIFISIDDNEVATLRLLMDEIFGNQCFVTQIAWQSRYSRSSDASISLSHNHIVIYALNVDLWRSKRNRLPRSLTQEKQYKNPDNDFRGPWRAIPWDAPNIRENLSYPITTPKGTVRYPPKGRCWSRTEDQWNEIVDQGMAYFGKNQDGVPSFKLFLKDAPQIVPNSWWPHEEAGHSDEAKKELHEIFFGDAGFATPKPTRLIQRILQIATDKDSLILDSFAGSGTSGHAVLKQNIEDSGCRRFILVEIDEGIAKNVTSERVRRVSQGYANAKGQTVEGLGGGFQFCSLSAEPLFTAEGQIRSDVTFAQLAEFVWFAETGTGFQIPASPPFSQWGMDGEAQKAFPFEKGGELARGQREIVSPLLGVHEGRGIYLLYNGILKDKSIAGGNVLTGPVFDVLPQFVGPKVIYAAANRMGGRATREGITFKQTPYALEV
ncbi:site-specific DNA-methyltransferase [Candidatus Nitrotoga sp. M5]|uniref:site-specific DNA-methyltransferase n=1 Tax=Candidatus Nitrotoga sp. M5 TaxID=2890409 RepID=UPI001EF202F0|nr:site-specific DNA-methyltransferase [Candidatus Nitrotoga sp. M5]CAH1385612.1 Type III restriction-modification system methylation subunit [Candidatus Nitrotoga sp. M5]